MIDIALIQLKNIFRWKTAKGELLTLAEMDTKHIFNAMKMIYNHLAEAYELPTVWFMNQYSDYTVYAEEIPQELALQICLFLNEIEDRGDLPEKYQKPYEDILSILKALGFKKYLPQQS